MFSFHGLVSSTLHIYGRYWYDPLPFDIGLEENIEPISDYDFKSFYKLHLREWLHFKDIEIEPDPNKVLLIETDEHKYYMVHFRVQSWALWKEYLKWKQYKALYPNDTCTWEECKKNLNF